MIRAMIQILAWLATAVIFWDAVGLSGVALVVCVVALVYSVPGKEQGEWPSDWCK